jgi:hypothetical protein
MADAAYWLYSLGLTRSLLAVPVWERVAESVRPSEEDFRDSMLGLYYYVDAVCAGAERLGRSEAVPALLQLHEVPLLREQVCLDEVQPDYFRERRAMLELAIGRALARCGREEGYAILLSYTADNRGQLRRQAISALRRLTGESFGADGRAWRGWLEANRGLLQLQPLQQRLDLEWNSESIARIEVHR